MTEYSATEFFESSFVSVNDPRQFVSSRRAKAFSRLPGYVYDLFRARALLHNGQSATALKILEQLRRSPEANTDHLFSGKLHLVLYSTKNDGLFSSAEIEEFLLLATRQTALSGSVALECELKIAQCLIYRGERDITTCEEQLRAAMALALASDHFELRLMVQLAYGVMYQLSDLHLIAKQELMLMRELADKQRYPNIYCIMLSHLGVSYLKERDPSSASL
ncbi:MAG: hypothetical protein FJ042_07995, partial [Candidatus Cloacimonetes bacterium]|nr:hypothetical protein [Candidatus Cloacimonadota bacterium]